MSSSSLLRKAISARISQNKLNERFDPFTSNNVPFKYFRFNSLFKIYTVFLEYGLYRMQLKRLHTATLDPPAIVISGRKSRPPRKQNLTILYQKMGNQELKFEFRTIVRHFALPC